MKQKNQKKTSFKIFLLQLLWIGFFILLITSTFIDLIMHYDLKRVVVNFFIIISCIISLLSEIYCFKFYSYILFIYTPIGRGIFMVSLTCLELNDNLFSLTICIILFINSIFYLLLSALFGGINKPLFNNSLKHKLNLIASVYFIDNKNKNDNHLLKEKKIKKNREDKKNHHHSHHQHNHHHHHHHHHNNIDYNKHQSEIQKNENNSTSSTIKDYLNNEF